MLGYQAALCALCVALPGAAVHAESLEKAAEATLNFHPSVESAIANRNALAEEGDERRSDYFPSVNVRGTGARMYADNSTSRGLNVTRGAGYSWLWEGGMTVTQPVFNGFETVYRVDAARTRADSAGENIADVREQLAMKTVATYLDVLRSRETVSRMKSHAAKVDDFISRIEKMVAEGAADAAMTEQAKDIRAQLLASLAGAEGQLRSAEATYLELTGHAPDTDMGRPAPRTDLIPPNADEAVVLARESHPTIKAALLTEQASGLDVDAEKATIYPDVNAEASYLKRDQRDLIGGESIDARAVVRLTWDYAVGGGQQARVRKTLHRMAQSKADLEAMKREVERGVVVAYSNHNAALEQMKLQKDRVTINEGLLKTQQAQFEAAKVNLLQLMQTENALFNAKAALLNGEYGMLAAQFAVLSSIGRLQEALNIVPVVADAQ